MGGKSSAPNAPDMSEYVSAIREGTRDAKDIAQRNFDWQKGIYNENKPFQDRMNQYALSNAADQQEMAGIQKKMGQQQLDMYNQYGAPSQRAAAVDSWGGQNLSSADRNALGTALMYGDEAAANRLRSTSTDNYVNESMGQVQAAGNSAAAQQARGLQRLGGDPNQMAAYSAQLANNQTAMQAGAANQARLGARNQGMGMMAGAAGSGGGFLSGGSSLFGGSAGMGNGGIGMMGGVLGQNLSAGNGVSSAYGGMTNAVDMGMQGAAGIMGQRNAQYAQQSANVNAANAQSGALTGALMGAAGTVAGAYFGGPAGAAAGGAAGRAVAGSDKRIKENIVHVGTTNYGLGLYEFNYIFDDSKKRYRGVMSNEVRKVMPEAVVVAPEGFDTVNYAMLGIAMEEV